MSNSPADRAPAVVRGFVLGTASVLLGVAGHALAGGGGLRPGSLLVVAGLLAISVATVLATGSWLAGRLCGAPRWAGRIEDAAAGLALVLGQAAVHGLSQPLPAATAPLVSGSSAHHASLTAEIGGQHAAHGALGGAMPVTHALAALVVVSLLRRLESCLLRLASVLPVVADALRSLVVAWQAPHRAPVRRPPAAPVGWDECLPAALAALGVSVVRRGPPTAGAFA